MKIFVLTTILNLVLDNCFSDSIGSGEDILGFEPNSGEHGNGYEHEAFDVSSLVLDVGVSLDVDPVSWNKYKSFTIVDIIGYKCNMCIVIHNWIITQVNADLESSSI